MQANKVFTTCCSLGRWANPLGSRAGGPQLAGAVAGLGAALEGLQGVLDAAHKMLGRCTNLRRLFEDLRQYQSGEGLRFTEQLGSTQVGARGSRLVAPGVLARPVACRGARLHVLAALAAACAPARCVLPQPEPAGAAGS
jgi:hypothetical protein